MAASSRRSGASLIQALWDNPRRFDFVQAVRVLERAAERAGRRKRPAGSGQVGLDNDHATEAVLLRAAMELVYPTGEVAALTGQGGKPELSVNFMGLNGPSGVLPGHYSQMVLAAQRDRNHAFRDFFDLFNHRALSFFARAAEKYRLPLVYRGRGAADPVSTALLALIGLREQALQRRQAVSDDAMAFYGGHLSRRVPSAGALEQMLSEYLASPVTVKQFVGRWAALSRHEQSRLGGLGQPGPFSQLGATTVVGSMVYDVQGTFRVGLGPLNYEQFLGFLPDAERMAELAALTRTYVGPVLSFDVQLSLKASEIPRLELSSSMAPRLGWNTWLPSRGPRADASEAVFRPFDS
jgi:type VI secretion system protein ImpH